LRVSMKEKPMVCKDRSGLRNADLNATLLILNLHYLPCFCHILGSAFPLLQV
jgi:hypothetical protein